MKSTAHVFGHPVHPVLIPFPFALLTAAVAFDVWDRVAGRSNGLPRTASHMTAVGLGTAVAAAVPGVVDYFGSVPARTPARRDATWHALLNLSALTCFVLSNARRDRYSGRVSATGLALGLAGSGLMSLAGWFGGELIYRHHVAVEEKPGRTPMRQVQSGGAELQVGGRAMAPEK